MCKKLIGCIFTIFTLILFLSGCSDQKSPDPGYISDENVKSIIDTFTLQNYTNYDLNAKLNYFDFKDEDTIPSKVSTTKKFRDSLDIYSENTASYMLLVPLHITSENWNNEDYFKSTYYNLVSKIYRTESLDKVYFYNRDGGGLIIKTFGVNKSLRIKNPNQIECHAKWNITIEYDKNGYLVKESFSTINKKNNNDADCCYGEVIYTFK